MRLRPDALRIIDSTPFDVCVIGGGATGAGCALDAQLRGLRTVLVDAADFASASSSASTKMAHGGVRYLQEAARSLDRHQYRLVKHALQERARMLRNAPHLARPLEFVVPCYGLFDQFYYGVGLKIYQWIAGSASLFPSRFLNRQEALRRMPSLKPDGLTGAVTYADGQFDDARYALAILHSFADAGGELVNYARVTGFIRGPVFEVPKTGGRIAAAEVQDAIAGRTFTLRARAFVNATGPVSDAVRQLASPGVPARMRPSKGVHLLFPLGDFAGRDALLVPRTEDGRVIFAIPWCGRLLVGTTDDAWKPGDDLSVTQAEVDYLLRQLNPYLARPLFPSEIVSGFAGIRPLVASQAANDRVDTKNLIRDDEVEFDPASGLISILGGKWTTYRLMAERTINRVQQLLGLPVTACPTGEYRLAGAQGYRPDVFAPHLGSKYGTRAAEVLQLTEADPSLLRPIVDGAESIRAQVLYAVRQEMAVTIEDVLARRIGLQLYSWHDAVRAAPVIGGMMQSELGWATTETNDFIERYTRRITARPLYSQYGSSGKSSG